MAYCRRNLLITCHLQVVSHSRHTLPLYFGAFSFCVILLLLAFLSLLWCLLEDSDKWIDRCMSHLVVHVFSNVICCCFRPLHSLNFEMFFYHCGADQWNAWYVFHWWSHMIWFWAMWYDFLSKAIIAWKQPWSYNKYIYLLMCEHSVLPMTLLA